MWISSTDIKNTATRLCTTVLMLFLLCLCRPEETWSFLWLPHYYNGCQFWLWGKVLFHVFLCNSSVFLTTKTLKYMNSPLIDLTVFSLCSMYLWSRTKASCSRGCLYLTVPAAGLFNWNRQWELWALLLCRTTSTCTQLWSRLETQLLSHVDKPNWKFKSKWISKLEITHYNNTSNVTNVECSYNFYCADQSRVIFNNSVLHD